LVDPTTLGVGEGASLVLSVGGFEKELKVLEGLIAEEKAKGTEVDLKTGSDEVKAGDKLDSVDGEA
jgi:hypothetical protein